MPTNNVSIVGNLTDDPELRFTNSGKAVANFTVAANRNKKVGDEWESELVGFFKVTAWNDLAENVAESLSKGTRTLVTGRLKQDSWENDDGQKRTRIEIVADEVGPSLKYAVVEGIEKPEYDD